MNNSWKPRLRGDTYCSPACGRGCTKAEYDAAKKQATELAKRLGKGWKPHVFENLGWYSGAISPCERIKIDPSPAGKRYTAYIGEAGTGDSEWVASAETPELALTRVVQAGKRELERIRALLEGL